MPKRHAAEMPSPEVYDDEIHCWPWRDLLSRCVEVVCQIAPKNGVVLDYMCGTGTLLAGVAKRRSDLSLIGCDKDSSYVRFARVKIKSATISMGDASKWKPKKKVNVVLATAGIHHLPFGAQMPFLEKIADEIVEGGHIVIGEEVLPRHRMGLDRERAVVEFFSRMIPVVLKNHPTHSAFRASLDVFANDLLIRGEFKRDLESFRRMVTRRFVVERTIRIWPKRECGFGDYIIIARKRRSS